jgi:hypothetical protein
MKLLVQIRLSERRLSTAGPDLRLAPPPLPSSAPAGPGAPLPRVAPIVFLVVPFTFVPSRSPAHHVVQMNWQDPTFEMVGAHESIMPRSRPCSGEDEIALPPAPSPSPLCKPFQVGLNASSRATTPHDMDFVMLRRHPILNLLVRALGVFTAHLSPFEYPTGNHFSPLEITFL